ncbi:uncharacterized protein LOC115391973 [Salarias fasciatus]|uniref:uncharacterized protein LOC115391973 n=1 Tax=Salarias fasciatus TaxID=181472 RepID=UPI0011770274|nr:uncharacterized protein LOC115391973 [Salarias fasciatus]
MDAGEPAGSSRSFPSCSLLIIEHVWCHNMMDILQAVGTSCWPDLDLQSLSLEESWRLRVASARVFSMVENRDVARFERVVGFLEVTHQLLPGLVSAIKHMKIMFGLKTLVIMKMLRDGQGTIDTVSKINQFFPNKLPQYQNHCSQREMFLMRKNHMDFKALAQGLTLDKNRLQEYIQSQMEEQYGERYAQKVEDRLLQYLRELEAALPRETHIDRILKKQNPVTEEEKLLLDVITSDHTTIAATLKRLLHCDATSCHPDGVCQPPEEKVKISRLSTSAVDGKTAPKAQPESFRGEEEVLLKRDSVFTGIGHSHEGGALVLKRNRKTEDIRQFCSKHKRWVRSILQECPDDCSNVSSSPPLFPSSSSTSSSQDLTPSNLVPSPSDRPPSQNAVCPAAGQTREPGCSRSDDRSSLSRDNLPSSVVPTVDVTSSLAFKPSSTCPDNICRNTPSLSGCSLNPPCQTSGNKDTASLQEETCSPEKTCQGEHMDTTDLPQTGHTYSRLSHKFRQTISCSSSEPSSDEFPKDPSNFLPGRHHVSTSVFQAHELENPEDMMSSESNSQAEACLQPSSIRYDPLPSLLSPVVQLDDITSSSAFNSNQMSPACNICNHHQVILGSSSHLSHQTSGIDSPISIQPDTCSDEKRLPDPQNAPTTTKLSRKYRQALKGSTSKLSAEEFLKEPSSFQRSFPSSSNDLPVSGSPPCPASPCSSQKSKPDDMSSESAPQTETSAQSPSCRVSVCPSVQSPMVHLVDTCSSSTSELSQTSLDRIKGHQEQAPMGSSPPSYQTSGNNVSPSVQPESCAAVKQSKASRKRPSNKKAAKYTSVFQNECPPSPHDHSVSAANTSNRDKITSGSSAQTVSPPQPGDNLLPSVLMPVVRLVDIYSYLNFKPNQPSPHDFVRYSTSRTPSGSGPPPRRTSREKVLPSVQLKTLSDVKTPPESQDLPLMPHKVSKLSSKFRKMFSNGTKLQISSRTSADDINISGLPACEASASTPQSFCHGDKNVSTRSSRRDIRHRPQTHTRSRLQTKPSINPPLRLSLQSQASVLQSDMLQPYVSLTRLKADEFQPTGASTKPKREEEDLDSSFDLNELYSDSSDSDVKEDPDPDYKPSLKKKRLLLEYENAKMASNT